MEFWNDFELGDYWAGLFCCDGYDLLASTNFSVVEGTPVSAEAVTSGADRLTVFPNPSAGQVTLISRANSSIMYVEVYNLTGNLLYQKEYHDAVLQRNLNLSSLDPGLYILKATSDSHTFTARIILE
jgi:hypothetical protein